MAAVNNSYICLACNTPFAGRKRKYCSKACGIAYRYECRNQKRRTQLIGHVCAQCGTGFDGYKHRRYCSDTCADLALAEQRKNYLGVRDFKRERWLAAINKGETALSFEDWRKEVARPQQRGPYDDPWHKLQDILAERNAKQAWNYWLDVLADDQWHSEYWAASGKPWNNPRLSVAEKYTSKYEHKKGFRDKERERTRMYKWSHPDTVAGWKDDVGHRRRRWNQAAISADGSVTKSFVRELLRQRFCSYCLCLLTKDNRHLDHVTPLSQDGIHSSSNLVACCAACNGSKGAKKLWQWALSSRCVYAKAA